MGPPKLPVLLGWYESASIREPLLARWHCLHDHFCDRQPILADEVRTFKALITVHKVLQEGHPTALKQAQDNTDWLESLTRGISADGVRGASLGIHLDGEWTRQFNLTLL